MLGPSVLHLALNYPDIVCFVFTFRARKRKYSRKNVFYKYILVSQSAQHHSIHVTSALIELSLFFIKIACFRIFAKDASPPGNVP